MAAKYKKAVIWGVGLMGGSLALALKKAKVATSVWGLGRNAARLKGAKKKLGLKDVATNPGKACAGADLIVLAGPFGEFEKQLASLDKLGIRPRLVVDMGSLKGQYVARWSRAAGSLPFVASHPMCGSEKTGYRHADATLFRGATCVLTPLRTSRALENRAAALWKSLGMKIVRMTPAQHDRKIGALSHLSHAAAFALVDAVGATIKGADYALAGTGYLDTTRVAAADPGLWTEIMKGNRSELLRELALLEKKVRELRLLVKKGTPGSLKARLARIAALRKKAGGR